LRARIAPVVASSSVTTNGAPAQRDTPSAHSTYAVIDSRRGRPDVFVTVSREILIGSSRATNCSKSSATPWPTRSNRL